VEKQARGRRAAFIRRRVSFAAEKTESELQIGASPTHTSAPPARRVFHSCGQTISNKEFRVKRAVSVEKAPAGWGALLPLLFSKMNQMS
jgi:hypothetical protein